MIQVQQGLFAVAEQMPCFPKDIVVRHYVLPLTLDRAEQEEAAARVLAFSQELDQWVGVSWRRIAETMKEDYDAYMAILAARDHNLNEQAVQQRGMQRYYIFCILTLGIYSFFVEKPTQQMREVPDEKTLPFTGIFAFGLRHVIVGIHELIEKGFLRRVTESEGEGENAFDVFFPTPALVSRIMQKQGVTS